MEQFKYSSREHGKWKLGEQVAFGVYDICRKDRVRIPSLSEGVLIRTFIKENHRITALLCRKRNEPFLDRPVTCDKKKGIFYDS